MFDKYDNVLAYNVGNDVVKPRRSSSPPRATCARTCVPRSVAPACRANATIHRSSIGPSALESCARGLKLRAAEIVWKLMLSAFCKHDSASTPHDLRHASPALAHSQKPSAVRTHAECDVANWHWTGARGVTLLWVHSKGEFLDGHFETDLPALSSSAKKLVGATVKLPITAFHVATSAVQLPVPSAGIASMIPPSGRGNNPSRVELQKNLIETSIGAVHYAAEALDIAASLTQNLPYIGAISKVLVEISKIADEVEAFKSSWKAVISKIQAIQTIIDDFGKCCNQELEGRSEDELPDMLKQAFKDFEACLVNVIVTMNKCKATSRFQLIRKRSKLAAEVAQCERAVDSALNIFQAKLQLNQWKDIRDIRNAVMDHHVQTPRVSKLNSPSAATILPPAPAIFFGRDKEVDRVVDLIVNDEPASVAIVGTGGIGKTSIALASIHHSKVQEHFQTQRFFLSCEATSTSDSLVQALLKLFGLSVDASSSTSPSDTLVLYLQSLASKCLLCLDNLETPWDSDKDQVETLLVKIVAVRHLTLVITSRDSDRPRGIKWSELKPIQPLATEAAIKTWNAISHSHDEFSILLIQAVECIPLAVTLLAQLAQTDSSKALWASWNSESTKFIRSDGSESRLNSLDLSIQLSIQSPRLRGCPGAIDFFGVLCMLPQGMPEMRISEFEAAFGIDFKELRAAIRVLKQCSLAYTLDGFLCVLSPIRQYVKSHQELTTPLTRTLFRQVAWVYMKVILANESFHLVNDIHLEIGNISAVLDLCLTEEQAVVEETIKFSIVCRDLGILDTTLLRKAATIAHKSNMSLEGQCYYEQGRTHHRSGKLDDATQALENALALHKQVNDTFKQAYDLQQLGQLYMKVDRLEDAEKALQSGLDLHQQVNDRLGEANDLRVLGELYMRLDRLEDAEKALQSALDLHKQINDRLGEANALQQLGKLYMRLDRLEDAEKALKSALDLHKQVNSRLGEANDLKQLGELYMRCDRLEDAEKAFQSALDIYQQVNSRLGEANALQQLGELYMELNRLADAEKALQSALDLHKQVNDRLGEANDLQHLGELYMRLDRLEDAEKALQSALDLHKQVNDRLGEAYDLTHLGDLYIRLDRLEDAEKALQSALDLHKQVNDRLGEAYDVKHLGQLYMRLDRLEDAEKALQSALDLHKQVNDRLGEANDLRDLGVLYMKLDRLEDAEKALQSALDLHKQITSRFGEANALQQLGKLYMRLHRLEDAEKALQSALDLYQQINDKLGEADALKQLKKALDLQKGIDTPLA
ncbi:hypothetical protein GGX14DRAFT_596543 [Mycena pura]|uniref:NB-ARC domain-containing protein n=1 Tax=Mycena pura TaxID=153505 RepID=A0AAD6UPY3_9AGAR|nr:hypothetical protein GGX14DRAFT_596543 [Mycena pura]